jgi:hypothetical protein
VNVRVRVVVRANSAPVRNSARNGYPGTRAPESIPATRVPARYPGTQVRHITRMHIPLDAKFIESTHVKVLRVVVNTDRIHELFIVNIVLLE